MRQIKRRAMRTVNAREREKMRSREQTKEGERGNAIMQERREDFARDRGKWRREKEMDLRKERRRKQKPFHSTSSTLHHSDQKENLRTTFAKTNPRR